MHVRVVWPVVGDEWADVAIEDATLWAGEGTTVDVVSLESGPRTIMTESDETLAVPGTVERVREAAEDGVDAVYISCFGDPGLREAQDLGELPVVGAFESAMSLAMTLGDRIGIISLSAGVLPVIWRNIRMNHLEERIGCVRSVELPELEDALGEAERGVLLDELCGEALRAVTAGEADVIVLGCTAMIEVAAALQARLLTEGFQVPVVDPTAAAMGVLETWTRMGVRRTRVA